MNKRLEYFRCFWVECIDKMGGLRVISMVH